jgi:uncharacterized protein (DUF305 family)
MLLFITPGKMTLPSIHRAVAACALVAAAGCSTHRQSVNAAPEPSAAAKSQQAAIARARTDSIRHPYTEADVQFMSGMIGHHAQAIVMAGWAPTHGANPSVQTLSRRIINAQQDEIGTMQTWLRDRNEPVPEATAAGMKMSMNGKEHEMLMPGMLTPVQMQQLDSAHGADFDRLFLTFMIQHHRGAVTMVKQLFGTYGAGQDETVFKFASDVNVDQTTEIARMQQMLAALPPAPHTP